MKLLKLLALVMPLILTAAPAQKPVMYLPCMMCVILDDDSSAKELRYYAEHDGIEYAFDTEAHRDQFVTQPVTWLAWYDDPEPEGIYALVPS